VSFDCSVAAAAATPATAPRFTTHRGFASGECAGKAGELGGFTNSHEEAT